jgi:hypothetical protein
MTVDLDAIVMFAHSEKQQAARDLEEDVRIHPMTAWADHEARWPSRS